MFVSVDRHTCLLVWTDTYIGLASACVAHGRVAVHVLLEQRLVDVGVRAPTQMHLAHPRGVNRLPTGCE